jgi:hypothetical protein
MGIVKFFPGVSRGLMIVLMVMVVMVVVVVMYFQKETDLLFTVNLVIV